MKWLLSSCVLGLFLAFNQHAASADKRVVYFGPTSGGITMDPIAGIAPVGPGGSEVWFPGGVGSIPAGKDWSTATESDFAQFDAVVFGDWVPGMPGHDISQSDWDAAVANRSVWSSAITGNMIVMGADPSTHAQDFPSARTLLEQAVLFAVNDNKPGPGLYVAVGEAYASSSTYTSFELLQCIGDFQVVGFFGGGPGDPCEATTVRVYGPDRMGHSHPVIGGLTSSDFTWTNCATCCMAHAGFGSWPGQFRPLAFAASVEACKRTPGYFDDTVATDGYGAAFILATQPPLDGLSMTPATTFGYETEVASTFTAKFVDANGLPIVGAQLIFAIEGRYPYPGEGDGFCDPVDCTTDAQGTVRWTVGPISGIPFVHVYADLNENGVRDTSEPRISAIALADYRLTLTDPHPVEISGSKYFAFTVVNGGNTPCSTWVDYSPDLITWTEVGGVGSGEFMDWSHPMFQCSEWWHNCDPYVAFRGAGYYRARNGLRRSNVIGYMQNYFPGWQDPGVYDGFTMLANPFNTANNTLNAVIQSVPSGTTAWKMLPTGEWEPSTYDEGTAEWYPNFSFAPGEGLFLQTAEFYPTEFTIIGEVSQGQLVNPIPAGWSGLASKVGQPGALQTFLKYPPQDGETVYKYNTASSTWDSYGFFDGVWEPTEPIMQIGESFLATRGAGSWIRNFSVWPAPPVADCPPPCAPAPSGLAAWWKGEDTTADVTGQNSGVPVGGLAYAAGKSGRSFAFNGADSHVRVPASSSLNVGAGSGFTIEAWINPSDLSVYSPLVEWNNGTGFGNHFWILGPEDAPPPHFEPLGPGNLYANVVTPESYLIFTAPGGTVQANTFQHVAFTYTKADHTGRFYKNGQLIAEYSYAGGTYSNSATGYHAYLGHRPSSDGAATFLGQMDEVAIYNRPLSLEEIQTIYEAANYGKCVP